MLIRKAGREVLFGNYQEVIKASVIVVRRTLFRQNISYWNRIRKRKQVRNNVDNKFHKRWNTEENT